MDRNLKSGVEALKNVPGWLHALRPSVWGPEAVWPASFGAGGFLMWELFKLIATDPTKVYPLLMSWGPYVFGTVIVAVILAGCFSRVMDVLGQNAQSQAQTAKALAEIAERMPSRSTTEDMQLQISYIGQSQIKTSEDVSGMRRALERIEDHLGIQPPSKE